MSLYQELTGGSLRQDELINGVLIGIVTNNNDPEGLGRVRMKITVRESEGESNWAPVATMMAGPGTGSYFIPEVGDKVLVAFLLGDIECPYVVGMLWDKENVPPEQGGTGNNIRKITSRSGHEIIMDDSDAGQVIVHTAGGQAIILDDSSQSIVLTAGESAISIDPSGVSINGTQFNVQSTMMNLQAMMVSIEGLIVNLQGLLLGLN
ncbi:MAG TPA: phage baseplate assembly protein V [Clostridia bacterium]|nr:phage baseplate assembly protein V [Clostridia bacterium]